MRQLCDSAVAQSRLVLKLASAVNPHSHDALKQGYHFNAIGWQADTLPVSIAHLVLPFPT